MIAAQQLDATVVSALGSLAGNCTNYWAFVKNSDRSYCHNYFQYPAMMVPEMLGKLMRTICDADPNVHTVFDPFAGSGTVLTESMLLGKSFVGFDINPLAILLCETKCGPFRYQYLSDVAEELLERINEDRSFRIEADLQIGRSGFSSQWQSICRELDDPSDL